MKRLALLVLALSLQAATSRAQSPDATKLEVAGGYSFFYIVKGFTIATNGVSGSTAFNANDWLGFVGDAGVYHGSPGGVGLTAETYTLGPRFSYRKAHRIVPFAQALFGGSHFSTDFSGNNTSGSHFAFSLGGGTDIALGRNANFRTAPTIGILGYPRERFQCQQRPFFVWFRLSLRRKAAYSSVTWLTAAGQPVTEYGRPRNLLRFPSS